MSNVSLAKLQAILSRYDVEDEQCADIIRAVEHEFGHELKGTKALASASGSAAPYDKDQFYRHNKWGVRIIKRGTDYDVAEVVKCLGFPDEKILGRAMWPDYAAQIVDEHNATLAQAVFAQDPKPQNNAICGHAKFNPLITNENDKSVKS